METNSQDERRMLADIHGIRQSLATIAECLMAILEEPGEPPPSLGYMERQRKGKS